MTDAPTRTRQYVVRSVNELAEFFGTSRQTIAAWKRRGMPQRRNGYDLAAVAKWRLKEELSTAKPADEADAKALNLLWQARTRELKFKHLIGELVRRDVVQSAISQLFNMIRQRLQAIPGELASGVPPEQRADVVLDLENRIAMILNQMANTQPLPPAKGKAK